MESSPLIDPNTDTSNTSDTNTTPTSPMDTPTPTPSSTPIPMASPILGSQPASSNESDASLNAILKNCTLSPAASALLMNFESIQTSEAAKEIMREYNIMIKSSENLDMAAEYMYEQLVDDAIMGVFLEVHHLHATGNLEALDGNTEDVNPQSSSYRINDKPDFDIFGMSTAKKAMDCTCPNCDRPVAAGRFAKHLAKCMGMDRKSRSSKRLANKDGSSSLYNKGISINESDDDDEVDDRRRKRTPQNARIGSKKNNGKSF